jgi:hypothetical protein
MYRAEAYQLGGWHTIDPEDALKAANPIFRCPNCHGRVFLVRSYCVGQKKNRFSHQAAFDACRSDASGDFQMHPDAIS